MTEVSSWKQKLARKAPFLRTAHRHLSASGLNPPVLASHMRSVLRVQNPKVFCVGRNKTGTTSLKVALDDMGYRIGHQRAAERMMEQWGVRDFRKLIRYCHSADAFQDIPFSLHYTFQAVDAAFPGSKFILTVRDSADQWYDSVVRFTTKRLAYMTGGRRPTQADLMADPYVQKGWSWRNRELSHGSLDDPFDPEVLKGYYIRHNALVEDYFRNRPDDLLVLNVGDHDAMPRLYEFLGHTYDGRPMPKLNASS